MAHLIQNKLCLFLKLEIEGEINCFTVVYLLLEFCLWKMNILIVIYSVYHFLWLKRITQAQDCSMGGLFGRYSITHNVLYKNVKQQSLI